MTIREQLLYDQLQNRTTAIAIAKRAVTTAKTFYELMDCFISDEYRLAQRAAWSVSYAAGINQELLHPHIKILIEQLLRTDVHTAVIRNSMRILKAIDIPEAYHGEVMNACFLLAQKAETPIAIKAFALSTLYNLSNQYPDIKNELQAIAEGNMISESAAVKSVSKKILNNLHKRKTPGIKNKPAEVKQHGSKHNIITGKQTNGAN